MIKKIGTAMMGALFNRYRTKNVQRKPNLERTVDKSYGINVNPGFYGTPDYKTPYRNSKPEVISKINLSQAPKKTNIAEGFNSRFDKARLEKANGNLEGVVQEFMREFVFNDNNFDYKGIGQLDKMVEYFNNLSKHEIGSQAKKTLETAKTVLSHLNDYVSLENKQGTFKKYLFGEDGVLTNKRLRDMNKIADKTAKYKDFIAAGSEDHKNYHKLKLTEKDQVSRFNVSYRNLNGSKKILVDINDNESKGMRTSYGNLHWDSFDKMFYENVNTRKSVTKYVKKRIQSDLEKGTAQYIKGYASYR